MFAAVEAQVQTSCGEWHFMRSHRDGASGLVQLGLTLQGRRHLRLAARRTPDRAPLTGGCAGENEVDVWAEGEQADATSSISVVTVPMAEGRSWPIIKPPRNGLECNNIIYICHTV